VREHEITLVNVSTAVPSGERGAREAYLPLGCLYLVSALEHAGVDVEFRDYQTYSAALENPLDLESFLSFLEGSAGVLGISCMVSMLPFVLLGTKKFKERHPEHTIILGGPGPSGVADEIIASMPWIDVVARGEGELTILELMQALRRGGDLSPISGISYRKDGVVTRNASRERIRNLDDVAFPAYERVNMEAYDNISIVSGRGCPFRCSFCDVGPLWENRTVFRSIENVIAELKLLKGTHRQKRVSIADDTFDLRRNRTEAFCGEMKGLGLNWSCLARIDLLDEKLLETMASAGCDCVFLGVESGSDAVLKMIKKRLTIKEATEKVALSTKYMKQVITSFIWGFPFETMDDFKSTLFSVVSMWYLGAMAGLKLLSPMPLSRLGIDYRDQLEFDEELCSVFASLGNIKSGEKLRRAQIPDELVALIREFPEIFAGFYYIKSDSIHEKAAYLRKFSEKRGILL
jgi:anaerobic magnesium-protoporphyrin IX monomethyl ester cyclase